VPSLTSIRPTVVSPLIASPFAEATLRSALEVSPLENVLCTLNVLAPVIVSVPAMCTYNASFAGLKAPPVANCCPEP